MTTTGRAWVTHAPADYTLVFTEDPDGDHAVVTARFENGADVEAAGRCLEGAQLADTELHVYCTLPGEAERVLARLGETLAEAAWADPGDIAFVAVGGQSESSIDAASGGPEITARIVFSGGGDGPRHYALEEQCDACGEFLGKIHVLPHGGVLLDTRRLSCRCVSIPCRYCTDGRVRWPLNEHLDPERRAGSVPWFGYLVPCGSCQVAGRGPRVQMSLGRGGTSERD